MDDLQRAMERALAAAAPFETVAPAVRHAVALARFQAGDPRDGPVLQVALSDGVPQPPARPLLPAVEALRGDARLAALGDALDGLAYELVWAADCAEFTDAVHTSARFLQAAGHLELAQRAALALLGPGLGVVLAPPATVRELAASLGRTVDGLGEPDVSFAYAWDVHHEAPVATAEALAARALTEYRIRLADTTACEAVLRDRHGAPVQIGDRRRYGAFLVGGRALEWHARRPGRAVAAEERSAGARALAALVARLRDGGEPDEEDIVLDPPLPAAEVAAILGAPEAFARTVDVHMSSWRLATADGPIAVGRWRVEAALDERPAGAPVPGVSIPAASAQLLAGGETVRHLRLVRAP